VALEARLHITQHLEVGVLEAQEVTAHWAAALLLVLLVLRVLRHQQILAVVAAAAHQMGLMEILAPAVVLAAILKLL
jgi:hypothetical protein